MCKVSRYKNHSWRQVLELKGWLCTLCNTHWMKEREVIEHIQSKHPITQFYYFDEDKE